VEAFDIASAIIEAHKKMGINVYIKDIASNDFDLGKNYDYIILSEILEHLPFDNFMVALEQMRRVAKKYVVLSLPRWGWLFYVKIKLPFLKYKKFYFKLSGLKKHKIGGRHFWEIGKAGYPLKKIKYLIKEQKFKIIKDYLDPDSPYHHFYILETI